MIAQSRSSVGLAGADAAVGSRVPSTLSGATSSPKREQIVSALAQSAFDQAIDPIFARLLHSRLLTCGDCCTISWTRQAACLTREPAPEPHRSTASLGERFATTRGAQRTRLRVLNAWPH